MGDLWVGDDTSCPARGMGVEMFYILQKIHKRGKSCPARGMGVEIDAANEEKMRR